MIILIRESTSHVHQHRSECIYCKEMTTKDSVACLLYVFMPERLQMETPSTFYLYLR